jgi:hypothetical protein
MVTRTPSFSLSDFLAKDALILTVELVCVAFSAAQTAAALAIANFFCEAVSFLAVKKPSHLIASATPKPLSVLATVATRL